MHIPKHACSKRNISVEQALFLDIRANIGWYSLLLAASGYQVVSFEPLSAHEQLLRSSICSNPYKDRMILFTDLLSDAVGFNDDAFPVVSVARLSSLSLFLLASNNARQKRKAVIEVFQELSAERHVRRRQQGTRRGARAE